jgi:hypothetical protein
MYSPGGGLIGRGVKLATSPRSTIVELYLLSTIRLHGRVLNYISEQSDAVTGVTQGEFVPFKMALVPAVFGF